MRKARGILSEARVKGVLRGRSEFVLLSASILTACRLLGNPLTLRDLSHATGISHKRLFHGYQVLLKALQLPITYVSPTDLVVKYGPMVHVSQQTVTRAVSIIETHRAALMGRSPSVVAATALYLASTRSNDFVTQKQLAHTIGIASKSIRNCLAMLQPPIEIPTNTS
jgi:transcription initiation factor TFIIIB Brf1 subunit/transcription initiation factor TFIIB